MLRGRYTQKIESLRDELLRLGSMVEHALSQAVISLENWDTVAAAQIIQDDVHIDEVWREVEANTVHLLATQQPIVATDLRLMTAVISIAGELERIGDYANSIAKRVRRAARRSVFVTPPGQLHELHQLAIQMVHLSLDAFLKQDSIAAHNLGKLDERVDELTDIIREDLLSLARSDAQKVDAVVDMLDVVHALERAADRATNIAERVIYLVTSDVETIN
jgi:phosphate transport system protein